MCWSFAASIIFTTIGLLASIYLIKKKDDKYLWIPLIYFSLMELLQVFTYLYLNQCDLPINQILTYLGYLHITFQPFFINMLFMHFIPTKVRDKISCYVYAVCFAFSILMLIKVYPFAWAEACKVGSTLCGTQLCSVSGSWHLAWMLPQKNFGTLISFAYVFPAFILPMLYGSWKINIYHAILGPALARLLASNPNEWPAVWCLFSIAVILVIFIPKLRKHFYVKKWYFWKYPFK
jgi:hypothetical protein